MAVYPCQYGSHRYSQAQQSAYVTVVAESRPETRKARLCPCHFEELTQFAYERLTPVDETMQASLVCEACDRPATDHVFCTLYPSGAEPVHFAGDFCVDHAQARLVQIHWPEWPSRTS